MDMNLDFLDWFVFCGLWFCSGKLGFCGVIIGGCRLLKNKENEWILVGIGVVFVFDRV